METRGAEPWWEEPSSSQSRTWASSSLNGRDLNNGCVSLLQIKYGGMVPKSYYVQDSVKIEYDSSVTISRGSVFQLEYDVTAPSSLLRSAARKHTLNFVWISLILIKLNFVCSFSGGSLPAMEQISGSECTDGPQRAKVRKWARCCRFCPANATTLTWSLKTAASPAPSPESVSDNALMLRRYRKELVHRLHHLLWILRWCFRARVQRFNKNDRAGERRNILREKSEFLILKCHFYRKETWIFFEIKSRKYTRKRKTNSQETKSNILRRKYKIYWNQSDKLSRNNSEILWDQSCKSMRRKHNITVD